MKLRFRTVHMKAKLPIQGERGIELVTTMILNREGDRRTHLYGLRVEIPEGHIGLLLPVPSIIDVIDKVGCLGIITPGDKDKELSAVFTIPDDMIHDFYKEGDVTATLIVIPYFRYETEMVNEF